MEFGLIVWNHLQVEFVKWFWNALRIISYEYPCTSICPVYISK